MDVKPLVDRDDPESADARPTGELDLTPREVAARRSRNGRRWPALIALLAIVVAIGFVLVHFLSDATTFYYNVDEAVAKKAEIGDRVVRLQGNVVAGSQQQVPQGEQFTLTYHGVSVHVNHRGEVPDLFQPAIPVIIAGHFSGDHFESDTILVKHDNTYDEKNSARVAAACRDAQQAATRAGTAAPQSPECAKALGSASTTTTP